MKNHAKNHAPHHGPHDKKQEGTAADHSHDKDHAQGQGEGPAPAVEKPADPVSPPKPKERTKEEIHEDQMLRLRADFDNFRKRTLRERDAVVLSAYEDIVSELLPVLDNMDMGLIAAADHGADKAFVDAYRMLRDQMYAALSKCGLAQIDVAGKQFDPSIHEAVLHMASADKPSGTITSEVRKGYMLGNRLLRASQVAVSSGPAAPAPVDVTGAAAPEAEGK